MAFAFSRVMRSVQNYREVSIGFHRASVSAADKSTGFLGTKVGPQRLCPVPSADYLQPGDPGRAVGALENFRKILRFICPQLLTRQVDACVTDGDHSKGWANEHVSKDNRP
jgi:hypothetical protein